VTPPRYFSSPLQALESPTFSMLRSLFLAALHSSSPRDSPVRCHSSPESNFFHKKKLSGTPSPPLFVLVLGNPARFVSPSHPRENFLLTSICKPPSYLILIVCVFLSVTLDIFLSPFPPWVSEKCYFLLFDRGILTSLPFELVLPSQRTVTPSSPSLWWVSFDPELMIAPKP